MNRTEASLRIVALTDSLAMARDDEIGRVAWDETWPYRVRESLRADGVHAEMVNCGRRQRTADTLVRDDFHEHVTWKRPDVVVLQVGAADCAPRLTTTREERVLGMLPVPAAVRRRVLAVRAIRGETARRRARLDRVRLAPERFEASIDGFIRKLDACAWTVRLLVLPIVLDAARAERHAPGFVENARLYNELLAKVCARRERELVTLTDVESARHFLTDGCHLSAEGNLVVARAVRQRLAGAYDAPRSEAGRATVDG